MIPELKNNFCIFIGTFSVEIENASILLQLKLVDFYNDLVLKYKYGEVEFPKYILI